MRAIVKDLPILDLRSVSEATISGIEEVQNVRTVVLDTSNANAFMRVPRTDVRSHVIVTPDETLVIGQLELTDQYLHSLASRRVKLVVLGHILIDGFTPSLFLQKIEKLRVFGQVLYADSLSVGALLSRLARLQGQFLRMPGGAVRWIGSTYLDGERLASVKGGSVISIGTITIDPAICPRDIASSIRDMAQIGEVRGREEAVSALMSVCSRRLGSVTVAGNQ